MELQILNVGKMWRVVHGNTVLAFASTYPIALRQRNQLIKQGVVKRIVLSNLQRRALQCPK